MASLIKTMHNYAIEECFYGLAGLLRVSHIANENGRKGIH
jgi:hypothetical protein